jgi:transposase
LTAVGIRSKKNNLFFPICSSKLQNIMPRLDNASRETAIVMLQLGATQGDVARRFRVVRNTIWRLWNRYRTTRDYQGPMLTQCHCQRRLEWARRHLRWRLVTDPVH